MINDARFVERAEVIREKGTNRSLFFRGQVDKYTWTDFGSSYLPSELISAFLWAQMNEADAITARRMDIWETYHRFLSQADAAGKIRRPIIPKGCEHNAHMYYLLLDSTIDRSQVLSGLREQEVYAVFHYIPLHSSLAGRSYSRVCGEMKVTDMLSSRLIRLTMWVGLTTTEQETVVDLLTLILSK